MKQWAYTSLSDEQKEAKQKEGAQLEEQYRQSKSKEVLKKTITNYRLGYYLFKQTFYNNSN